MEWALCDSSCHIVFAFHKNKEYPDLLEKSNGREEYERFYGEVTVPSSDNGVND